MTITALDVGGYIYERQNWIDAWRLQKLTYFAQAWHLVWDGRPAFEDEFQAWSDGPVQPELFRVNKWERAHMWSTELPGAHPEEIPPATKAMIDAVLDFYGNMPKARLVELSHEQPWVRARGGLGPDEYCAVEVAKSDMRRWYTTKQLHGEQDIPRRPVIGAAGVSEDGYQAAVASTIQRWADTLALLAER